MQGEQVILTGTREEAAPVTPRVGTAEAGTRGGCKTGSNEGAFEGFDWQSAFLSGHAGVQGDAQACSARWEAQGGGWVCPQ